jgi:hypothetical protein
MKKILVKIGIHSSHRSIFVEDLTKLYYIKSRPTPKLPKFT